MKKILESNHPVDAIRPEDAELALVIPAEIDETTTAPSGAGQSDLMDRPHALPVFIFKQNKRLTRHRRRQTEVRKCNQVTADWPLRRRER